MSAKCNCRSTAQRQIQRAPKKLISRLAILACCGACLAFQGAPAASPPQPAFLSPTALAATPEGKWLFVACATARQIAVFDVTRGTLAKPIPLPDAPSGLALSPDGARLYVTCAAPQSHVSVLDATSGKVLATLSAGHTAMAPVLSRDGKTPLQQRHQRD
jgi:DNA-binding beta-propeller fold protein YncE